MSKTRSAFAGGLAGSEYAVLVNDTITAVGQLFATWVMRGSWLMPSQCAMGRGTGGRGGLQIFLPFIFVDVTQGRKKGAE